MAVDTIALRTTYEVPMLWLDRAHGRERLASLPAEATFQLRCIAPGDMRPIEGNLYDEAVFEGATWKPLPFASPDAVGRLREMMSNEGMAACAWLALGLPTKLTTVRALGAFEESGLPARITGGAIERLDAEARERARLMVERDFLWDGGTLHYAASHPLGMPQGIAALRGPILECVGAHAIRLLEYTSTFSARDPEAAPLAADVRRVAIRALVHAIPRDAVEAAVLKVARLAEVSSRRAPGRSARAFASMVADIIRSGVMPELEASPNQEDDAFLSGLAR